MSDSEKHAAGHVWRLWHAQAHMRTYADTYSRAHNEASMHTDAPAHGQGNASTIIQELQPTSLIYQLLPLKPA